MKIVTWVLQGLLSVPFLMAGFMKVTTSYKELMLQENMGWVEDFSPETIRFVGTLEIMAVIGMTLPILIKKYTFFSPLAAIGLVGVMTGAIITHIGRDEPIMFQSILIILAFSVAYLRRNELGFK